MEFVTHAFQMVGKSVDPGSNAIKYRIITVFLKVNKSKMREKKLEVFLILIISLYMYIVHCTMAAKQHSTRRLFVNSMLSYNSTSSHAFTPIVYLFYVTSCHILSFHYAHSNAFLNDTQAFHSLRQLLWACVLFFMSHAIFFPFLYMFYICAIRFIKGFYVCGKSFHHTMYSILPPRGKCIKDFR